MIYLGIYEKTTKSSPKPILSGSDAKTRLRKTHLDEKKRISWADSAISSSGSPSQDTR